MKPGSEVARTKKNICFSAVGTKKNFKLFSIKLLSQTEKKKNIKNLNAVLSRMSKSIEILMSRFLAAGEIKGKLCHLLENTADQKYGKPPNKTPLPHRHLSTPLCYHHYRHYCWCVLCQGPRISIALFVCPAVIVSVCAVLSPVSHSLIPLHIFSLGLFARLLFASVIVQLSAFHLMSINFVSALVFAKKKKMLCHFCPTVVNHLF